MKAIFALTTIILIAIAGLVSVAMFRLGDYDLSALLVLTSFLSTVLWVHVISSRKVIIR